MEGDPQSKIVQRLRFETVPLKEIFSDLEQRKRFSANKLATAKLMSGVLIRVEPHKGSKMAKRTFLTLVVPFHLDVAYLNGEVAHRLSLPPQENLYLFTKHKLLLNSRTIKDLSLCEKEDDNIVYVDYAEIPTF